MTKPVKLKHGYVRLANALMEHLVSYQWTSPLGLRLVLHVVRQSYGFNRKKTNPCSLAELATTIRAPRSSVHLALEALIRSSVLVRDELSRLSIQKNYEEWAGPVQSTGKKTAVVVQSTGQELEIFPSSSPVQSTGQERPQSLSSPLDKVSSPLDKVSSPLDTYKEKDNLKDNLKDNIADAPPAAVAAVRDPLEGFGEWYAKYPEKKARGAAERAWKTLKPDAALRAALMAALAAQKAQRLTDARLGVFVPQWAYPATWLNQKRWQDEMTPAAPATARAGIHAQAGKYEGIGERHETA